MSLARKAKIFAVRHHGAINHVRKYTGEPYINHPAAVAALVQSVPHTEEMTAAAWLHDVVEDTQATLEDVEREFGPKVASLVEQLTDISKHEDGNRQRRKEIDRAHTARSSSEAKTIKIADLIDNAGSIMKHDPEFARVYMEEKAGLLEVLREGNYELWINAFGIVKDYWKAESVKGKRRR